MSNSFLNTILALTLIYLCSANDHDYSWGTIAPTDTLMAKETVVKAGFFGRITTEEYVYKQVGVTTPLTISAIKIKDKKKFKGASAAIVSGGVGATEVTIKFTSLRGSGIKSLVEIYGA